MAVFLLGFFFFFLASSFNIDMKSKFYKYNKKKISVLFSAFWLWIKQAENEEEEEEEEEEEVVWFFYLCGKELTSNPKNLNFWLLLLKVSC